MQARSIRLRSRLPETRTALLPVLLFRGRAAACTALLALLLVRQVEELRTALLPTLTVHLPAATALLLSKAAWADRLRRTTARR